MPASQPHVYIMIFAGEQRAAAVHPAMSIASLVRNVEMRPEPSFLYFAP